MGTKGKPQISNLIVGAAPIILIILMMINAVAWSYKIDSLEEKIAKQDGVIIAQAEKIEMQGSLTNQQEQEIKTLHDANIHLNQALEKQQTELQETIENKDESIKKLSAQIAELKKTKEDRVVMPSRGTSSNNYKEFYVSATGYTAYCVGCSGKTAWKEIDLRKNPNMKVIAVDPRIIPLGSKVHVEGYGYAIAADKGGAIKGYKIDLFYPETSTALEWGRKKVRIKVFY